MSNNSTTNDNDTTKFNTQREPDWYTFMCAQIYDLDTETVLSLQAVELPNE